jgi:hypothetical protein
MKKRQQMIVRFVAAFGVIAILLGTILPALMR